MINISSQKRLLVGKINGLFGVGGWVKIFSHTQPRKNILSYQPWLVKIEQKWQTLEVENGREQGKTLVAKINAFDTPEQAESLIGLDIYIEKSQLPKLQKGEHYWRDLIGLTVINQQQKVLGKVEDLVDTGANNVLIVGAGKSQKEHWIPYVKPFLLEVDITNGQILVDWDEDF
ncbi:MAG: ribosome maturation factor RimM [Candidatus Thioglobus sp.]|nr:ribosome maturation factor RimM [Candidatus Thioglobus sp.]